MQISYSKKRSNATSNTSFIEFSFIKTSSFEFFINSSSIDTFFIFAFSSTRSTFTDTSKRKNWKKRNSKKFELSLFENAMFIMTALIDNANVFSKMNLFSITMLTWIELNSIFDIEISVVFSNIESSDIESSNIESSNIESSNMKSSNTKSSNTKSSNIESSSIELDLFFNDKYFIHEMINNEHAKKRLFLSSSIFFFTSFVFQTVIFET